MSNDRRRPLGAFRRGHGSAPADGGVGVDASTQPSLADLAALDGAAVDELLREVSEFRLALDVDLTVAAAAADAADDDDASRELPLEVTAQALAAGQDGMAVLRRRARSRAAGHESRTSATSRARDAHPASDRARRATTASAGDGQAGRGRRGRRSRLARLPLAQTAPLVAVAVALGLGGGAYASHLRSDSPKTAADSSLATLTSAVGQGNVPAALAAGHQLQADVAALINQASSNPQAAHDAATLLLAEQTVISQLPPEVTSELQQTMQAQAVMLQQLSGDSVATLATLPISPTAPVTLPSVPAVKAPAVTRPTIGRPILPSPLHSLVPTSLKPPVIVLVTPPASSAPSPTSSPSASAVPSTTPSATDSPSSGATTPAIGIPTSGAASTNPLIGG